MPFDKKEKIEAKVFRFPLFRKDPAVRVSDDEVSVRKRQPPKPELTIEDPAGVDLTGRPKAIFLAGAGGSGKTHFGRWAAERAIEAGRSTSLAAVDPQNRDLGAFINGVHEPESYKPAAVLEWLESFLEYVREEKATAAIDLGGGDTSFTSMLGALPDFDQMMEDAGVSPVLFYLLSPRLSDLGLLAELDDLGFRPRATALVLNEGRADLDKSDAFARTIEHSAFRAAVERGAVVIRMPRLIPAKEVEDRRITFAQARDRVSPPGRNVVPLGAFDQRRVAHWLAQMEAAFAPVGSWLP